MICHVSDDHCFILSELPEWMTDGGLEIDKALWNLTHINDLYPIFQHISVRNVELLHCYNCAKT